MLEFRTEKVTTYSESLKNQSIVLRPLTPVAEECGSRICSRLKNYLRKSLVRSVSDAHRDILYSQPRRNFASFAGDRQSRAAAFFPDHFQVDPTHAMLPAGA